MPHDNKDSSPLGRVDADQPNATNERVVMRAPKDNRARMIRNQFVRIRDAKTIGVEFLGRIISGPFFADRGDPEGGITADVEIQGELVEGRPRDTNNRPATGSSV